jgi:hypothetical protein
LTKEIIKQLSSNNLKIHLIGDMIPDYFKNVTKYVIRYPNEMHPNYVCTKKVADYILNHIIQMPMANLN